MWAPVTTLIFCVISNWIFHWHIHRARTIDEGKVLWPKVESEEVFWTVEDHCITWFSNIWSLGWRSRSLFEANNVRGARLTEWSKNEQDFRDFSNYVPLKETNFCPSTTEQCQSNP